MSKSSVKFVEPIVDAEVHIHECRSELAEHADGSLRRAMETPPPEERWLDTTGLSPLTAYEPPIGENPHSVLLYT